MVALGAGAAVMARRPAAAQTAYLNSGDVAVTCVDTSGTDAPNSHDKIQLMPLVPLPVLTDENYRIQYTDMEADTDGNFSNDENVSGLEINGGQRAGEPVTDDKVDGLNTPNDQVFLFQGYIDELGAVNWGNLLWGFQISTDGGWASTPTSDVSALPTVLAQASVALKTNGNTVFAYTGPLIGTRAYLQAAIANPANWTGGATCPPALTVTEPDDGGTDRGPDGEGGGGTDAADGGGQTDTGDAANQNDADASAMGAGGTAAGGMGAGGMDAGGMGTGGMGAGGASGSGGPQGAGGAIADAGAGDAAGTGGMPAPVDASGAGGATGTGGKTGLVAAAGASGTSGAPDAGDAGGVPGDGQDAGAESPDGSIRVIVNPGGCGCGMASVRGDSSKVGVVVLVMLAALLLRSRARRSTTARDRRWGKRDGRTG
jgi:MYXO-CTERM domain-containing protein